ncbi:MAG: hypothetical protein ACE5H2_01365 [Terriglobia bacterium]
MWTSRMLLLVLLGWGAAAVVRAEEFHLQDGSKVRGRIVGFEQGTFRVRTNAGVVLIRRDQIRRIVFYLPQGPQTLDPGEVPIRPGFQPARSQPVARAPEVRAKPRVASPAPTLARSLSRPVPPPKPEKIIERVTATSYTNESFGFRMFKPPTWRSFPTLVKPDNPLLAVLGTPDETTLLLVGQEIFRGDLATYTRLAEDSLRQLYPDYRKLRERSTRFAGFPAVERYFTGSIEGRFWTGLAIYFSHGDSHYTFLGVTAEDETLSFQLSLLRKVVNTVEFGVGH